MKKHEYLDAIRKLQFFAIDLNLYLDNFPNCKDAIDDYKLISSKLRKLMWDYEQSYGPLTNFGSAYIQNLYIILFLCRQFPLRKKFGGKLDSDNV